MIFADKVIELRKKNGWSQEELADKMDVSRQAVSKWESAQTVPDLNKMIQLSELFGVTTDYLLKDELESAEFVGDGEGKAVKKVTLAEAHTFLQQRKSAAGRIAAATFMCIFAFIPLFLLGVASENPVYGVSEAVALGVGLPVGLVIIAAAVAIFCYCGFKNAPFEFLEKEQFETEYGVRGLAKEKKEAYRATYMKWNIIGTTLCILSPVSLFVGAFSENDFFAVMMLTVTMLVAGVGVVFFVTAGVINASFQKLLQEGEYSESGKKKGAVTGTVSLIYWLSAVAIYLGISLSGNAWEKSWIVWPIAGVLYAAVIAICNLVVKNKDK